MSEGPAILRIPPTPDLRHPILPSFIELLKLPFRHGLDSHALPSILSSPLSAHL